MPKPSIGGRQKTKNSQERLATALRENLHRRKAQARARGGSFQGGKLGHDGGAHGENAADVAREAGDEVASLKAAKPQA